MNFLHYEFDAGPQDIIEVVIDKQANVKLLDNINFQKYRRGNKYRYHGGRALKSPVHLRPPHQGHWHVVIDLGGYAGSVRGQARLIRG